MSLWSKDQFRLKNNSMVQIRPSEFWDAELLVDMYSNLSQETIYNRFFVFRSLSMEEAKRIATVSSKDEIALVGAISSHQTSHLLADARIYIQGEKGEIGIVVRDEWQDKGLGTALVDRLIKVGRKVGLKRLFMYCLPDNVRIIHIGQKLGFRYRKSDLGVIRLEIILDETVSK